MDSHKVEDKEVWEALSNLELFFGKYVKPGDPDETRLPPEQSNFTPSVSKLLSFTQLEFRLEDSIHFEKYGVSAASVEAEPCVVGIESSNNERWSGYNFPWGKGLEEFSGRLFGNFSLEPEQREVINATMSGHDVFAEMSAVKGSEVTYQVPALLCPGMTLVVVPLPSLIADRVAHPILRTEQQRILGELVKKSCECKLLYITADTITESELLLEHLEIQEVARIVVESVCKRDYEVLFILKQSFPAVPLVALASSDADRIKDAVVSYLRFEKSVQQICIRKRLTRSRVSSPEQSERGVSHAHWIVASSWMVEKSKIGRRQRRQTTLLQELCLLNSIYGEHFLLDFKSGIDISIPLRVLLSKDILKDKSTILKINWTDTRVGIDIDPRDGVNDPLTFQKLRSAAEQEHIKGSIKALLNAVRKTFDFGEIPIMVGHIIYPKFEREYEPKGEIGEGDFGVVYKCTVKLDDTDCAVKLIRFPASIPFPASEDEEEVQRTELEKKVQRVINEVKMLSLAQHPNVVRYSQAWIEDYREQNLVGGYHSGSASYGPRQRMMYIHMELCKESLKSKLAKEELPRHMAWRYFRQILEALQFIHGKDIIHRDLKPDNIFIDNSRTVKIGDFGFALRKDVSSTPTNSSPVGAELYRAPEMKERDPITNEPTNKPTNKVDMYALGLIVVQLFCPRRCSEQELLKLTESPEQDCEEYEVDETAKPLILELLKKDPSERPSAADLLRRLDGLEGKKQEAQLQKLSQHFETDI